MVPYSPNLKWIALAAGVTAVAVAVYLQWFFNSLEKQRAYFAWEQWLGSQSFATAIVNDDLDMIANSQDQTMTLFEWLVCQDVDYNDIENVLSVFHDIDANCSVKIDDGRLLSYQLVKDYRNQVVGFTVQVVPIVHTILQTVVQTASVSIEAERAAMVQEHQKIIGEQQAKIAESIQREQAALEKYQQLEVQLAQLCQGVMSSSLYVEQGKETHITIDRDSHPLLSRLQKQLNNLLSYCQQVQGEVGHYQHLLSEPDQLECQADRSPLKYVYILAQSLCRNSEELADHNKINQQIFDKLHAYFEQEADRFNQFKIAIKSGFEESQKMYWSNLKFAEMITLTLQVLHAQQTLLQVVSGKGTYNRFIQNSLDKLSDLTLRAKQNCHQLLSGSQYLKTHMTQLQHQLYEQCQVNEDHQREQQKQSHLVELLRCQTEQINTRLSNIQAIEVKINEKCADNGVSMPNQKRLNIGQFEEVVATRTQEEQRRSA